MDERNDPHGPRTAVLLEQVDWVRALARHLVRDPGDADEVVQETWLAAVAHPPRALDSTRSVRAWLGRVVRNAAHQLARREGRRRDVEALAHGPDESTDDLLERAEVTRDLVGRVLALREPYRRTLLLRYFDELSPKRIAAREGVPVASVKTRLRRGLALLRADLEARAPLDERRHWTVLLAPLAGGPRLPELSLTGALLMSTKTVVVVAVAATALLVYSLWESDDGAMQAASPQGEVADLTAPVEEAARSTDAAHPVETEGRSPVEASVPTPVTESPAAETTGSLEVLVVDTSGSPVAGIPVSLGRGSPLRGWWDPRFTDQEGRAVFSDVRKTYSYFLEDSSSAAVFLDVPFRDSVARDVDTLSLPPDPIRLVLPPIGWVDVTGRDEEGELLERNTLFVKAYDTTPDGRHRFDRHDRTVMVEDGFASFPTGLGLQLQVELAGWAGEPRGRDVQQVTGPKAAGERVAVEVAFPHDLPAIQGTIVLESGEPVAAETDVELWFVGERGEHQLFARLGESGRMFERLWSRRPFPMDPGEACTLRLQLPGLLAEIPCSFPSKGSTLELGTIVLREQARLATGRVLDDTGAEVHALVSLARMDEDGYWRFTADKDAPSDPGTGFVFRGKTAGDLAGLALAARANDHLRHGAVPLPPAGVPIDIVLTRQGVVTGSCLLDEDIPGDYLWVHVRSLDLEPAPLRSSVEANSRPGPSGAFRVERVWPGRNELMVHLPGDPRPLVRIPEFTVRPGEETDPMTIDLTGRLGVVTMTVLDPVGEPISGGFVSILSEGGVERRVSFLGEPITLLLDRLPVDLEVVAPGYRTVRLDGVSDDQEVTLERGIPVRVQLPEDLELPPDEARLRVGLIEEQELRNTVPVHTENGSSSVGGGSWTHAAFREVSSDREVVFEVPMGGPYRVQWRLDWQTANGPRSRVFWGDPSEVLVPEGGTTLVSGPRRERYLEALASLSETDGR